MNVLQMATGCGSPCLSPLFFSLLLLAQSLAFQLGDAPTLKLANPRVMLGRVSEKQ